MALWGEISSPGNAMSLIFPRIVAFAERTWTNPAALTWEDLDNGPDGKNGAPPQWYWDEVLEEALARLNAVVSNFDLQGFEVSRLQPRFCEDNPEFCTNYTNDI